MSYLGCIGYIVHDTGLTEVLEQIYASNTVKHILTGHAVPRAMRARCIVDLSINIMLLMNLYNTHSDTKESDIVCPEDIDTSRDIYERTLCNDISVDEITSCEVLNKMREVYYDRKIVLKSNRTARIWIQYVDMVSNLRRFIVAERMGNFALHLKTLQEMLPYLTAAGHTFYAKSVHIHLRT